MKFIQQCVLLLCVVGRPLRSVWRGLPFFIVASLLLAASIPGCHKNRKQLLDGGHLVRNDHEVYWEAKYFPIEVFVDTTMPNFAILGVYEAVSVWNGAIGKPVFVISPVDFMEELPRGCGWIAAVYKEIHTDGLWRGIQKEGTSQLCMGEVSINEGSPWVYTGKLYTHELGHGLGLAHDPGDKRSIMHQTVYSDYPQYVMPDDVASVRKMMDNTFSPMSYSVKVRIEQFLLGMN